MYGGDTETLKTVLLEEGQDKLIEFLKQSNPALVAAAFDVLETVVIIVLGRTQQYRLQIAVSCNPTLVPSEKNNERHHCG